MFSSIQPPDKGIASIPSFFGTSSSSGSITELHTEEELLTALRKGSFLLKHGRQGRPKVHYFRLSGVDGPDLALRWRSASGSVRAVSLVTARDIFPGQASENFRRHPLRDGAPSFSLRYEDASGTALSLDLTCKDKTQYDLWFYGLQHAARLAQHHRAAASDPAPLALTGLPLPRPRTRSLAQEEPLCSSPKLERGFDEASWVRDGIHNTSTLGDVYCWGSAHRGFYPGHTSGSANPPSITGTAGPDGRHNAAQGCWPRSLVPVPAPGNQMLDATAVAVGRRHAAILSTQGALYMVGEGRDGKLGRGHDADAHIPHRLHRGLPDDSHILAMSCGDDYTAAIVSDGQLYAWGRHPGSPAPTLVPVPVRGDLAAAPVCQVSCGPFHCAAVTADGRLFTWGEGFGGKLGLGDQRTRQHPTHVESLTAMPVLQVACGVWHTAAIVLEPPGIALAASVVPSGLSGSPRDQVKSPVRDARLPYDEARAGGGTGITNLSPTTAGTPSTPVRSPGHRRTGGGSYGGALDHPSFVGAEGIGAYQEGRGGTLYTWGGVNEPVAFGEGGERRDSNHGCLGHGDLDLYTGQLLPMRVGGTLEGRAVRRVAAGLHLTVALTTSGAVYQMGSTGASGGIPSTISSKGDSRGSSAQGSLTAVWEGATSPEPVRGALIGHFVDAVACGMHHVIALGRPIEKKTGRPVFDGPSPSSVTFSWGRGTEGQLGSGKFEDSVRPLVIEALRGRRCFSIGCGSSTTMAVCEHDERRFDEEPSKEGKESADAATRALLTWLDDGNNNPKKGRGFEGLRNSSALRGGLRVFSFSAATSSETSRVKAMVEVDDGERSSQGGGVHAMLSRFSASSTQSHSIDGEIKQGKTVISIPLASPAGNLSRMQRPLGGGLGGSSSVSDLGSTSSLAFRSEYTDDAATAPSKVVPQNNKHTMKTFLSNRGSRGFEIISPAPSVIGGETKSATNDDVGGFPTMTLNAKTQAEGKKNAGFLPPSPGQRSRPGLAADGEDSRSASSVASLQQELRQSGRYIVRLEQRLAALQRKAAGPSSESTGDTGDQHLHATVVATAEEYRERMRLATSNKSMTRNSLKTMGSPRVQAGLHPAGAAEHKSSSAGVGIQGASITYDGENSGTTPEKSVQERLLERKRAELEVQESQLAAWAEKLKAQEAALEQVVASLRQPVEPQKEDEDGRTAVRSPPVLEAERGVGAENSMLLLRASMLGDDDRGLKEQRSNDRGSEPIENQWTEEMEEGVSATFARSKGSPTRLLHLRFSRSLFTPQAAAVWYEKNKLRIARSTPLTGILDDDTQTVNIVAKGQHNDRNSPQGLTRSPPTKNGTLSQRAPSSRDTWIDSKNLSFDADELDTLAVSLQASPLKGSGHVPSVRPAEMPTSGPNSVQHTMGESQCPAASVVREGGDDGAMYGSACPTSGGREEQKDPVGEPFTPVLKSHLKLLQTDLTSQQRPWSAPAIGESSEAMASPPVFSPQLVRQRQLTPPPHVSGIASEHLPPSARAKRAILDFGSPEEAGAVLFGGSLSLQNVPLSQPLHEESWHSPQGTPGKVPTTSRFGSRNDQNPFNSDDRDLDAESAVLTDISTRPQPSVRRPRSAMGGVASFALDNVSASPTPSPSQIGVIDGATVGRSPQPEEGGGVLRKALSRLVRSFTASSETGVGE